MTEERIPDGERLFYQETIIRMRKDLGELLQGYRNFEDRARYDIETLNQNFHKNLDGYFARLQKTVLTNINLKLQEEVENVLKDLMEYIAKRENVIFETLQKIKESNTKKIHLDLTLDGYEMVKRTPAMDELEIIANEKYNAEETVKLLINTLTKREKAIMCMRYGLLGEKILSPGETASKIGVSPERCRQIVLKSLRKLRHPTRKHLVEQITHKKLKEAILGETS